MQGKVMLRALGGPRFRSGPFYQLSISRFSSCYQSSNIESWHYTALEFQLCACKSHGLPFGISSFNLEPCSKHIGDGKFGSFERSIVAHPEGTQLLAGHQVSEIQGIFRVVAVC